MLEEVDEPPVAATAVALAVGIEARTQLLPALGRGFVEDRSRLVTSLLRVFPREQEGDLRDCFLGGMAQSVNPNLAHRPQGLLLSQAA